ncbi:hypothetical protein E8E13_007818 [Curvularia kusanoi]|uniref:C3H1-type domain-containing protein n=1 Tax=Curvularia kusanoi TaxID=90978 RepID=A0A9P4TCB3_CURKU|nr:hypothetical protein E8E13_007818 [Curvularia kusanoi]
MSPLEDLRAAMSGPPEVFQDYDTDTVSVTSTVPEDAPFYTISCIIGERAGYEDCYLCLWDGYPLSECTWEPPHHLDGTDTIARWNVIKQTLGNKAFESLNQKHIADFEQAKEASDAAKTRRKQKREKKRRQMQRRSRRIVDDSESSDEEPLAMAPREAPQRHSTGAIKFVDEPTAKQRREWSTDHHYSKLKYRGLAEKRCRTESTPDFSALSFVNAQPPTLPRPAPPRSTDDPYGRREPTHRRVEEDHLVPLKDWERRKIPLMCYQFYHSLSCPFGPIECKFMHRELDPQGNPYAVGEADGYVKPKHRIPPLTCLYWLRGNKCKKSSEDCVYAHNNTGWTDYKGAPMEIRHLPPDRTAEHETERTAERTAEPTAERTAERTARSVKPRDRSPPLTCYFWLTGNRCRESSEKCAYAHENTGWTELNGSPTEIKDLPPNLTAWIIKPKEIRQSLPERTDEIGKPPTRPKDITCHFWLNGDDGCSKPDKVCLYAHRNTGWTIPHANRKLGPVPIDPTRKPRGVLPKEATPPVTCPYWLRSEKSCDWPQDECRYAHWNTGWAPPGLTFDTPWSIDPNERPRSEILAARKSSSTLGPSVSHHNGEPASATGRTVPSGPRSAAKKLSWFRKTDPIHASSQTGQGGLPTHTPLSTPHHTKKQADGAEKHVNNKKRAEDTEKRADDAAAWIYKNTLIDPTTILKKTPVQSLAAMQNASSYKHSDLQLSQLRRKIGGLWDLDFVCMFNSGRPGDTNMLARNALLLYSPQDHPQEIELISQWLLTHDVRVQNFWNDGGWVKFAESVARDKSGVIIAHPDFDRYIEIPSFGKVLAHDVRVWSVGVQPSGQFVAGAHPEPPEMRRDCVGLFPHGGFIYITNEVFEQTPQLALKIIQLFFDKIEQLRKLDGPVSTWLEVVDACLLWRICVRPELMEYLYQKCKDNDAELAAENSHFLSYYELYLLLFQTSYIEQDPATGWQAPLSSIEDKYPIMSMRREYAENPALDYFNLSAEDANSNVIGYYAALHSADLRRMYRKFYVVHTNPSTADAQHWLDTIHNISGVMSPKQCIEELSKPGKESLIDFLDWAMKPKEEVNEEGKKKGAAPDDEVMGDAPMDISPARSIVEVEHTAY